MNTVIIFICIILIASILQTSTGFGFSIMATPFLLLIFLPQEAIQINLILSLLISLSLIYKIRKEIDYPLLKRFIIGSIAGVPFGSLVFMSINVDHLKFIVSVIILVLTLFMMVNLKIKTTPFRDYLVGGLSGVLTTSIGMPGPPLLLYFTGTDTGKEKVRATTLAFYLFIYLISLGTQVVTVGTNMTVWKSSLYAIPLVILGLVLGQFLFKWFNQRVFRIFTYVLLISTGVYLLIDSL
ncbi:putative membrane protein YfcA [Bacillus pakistanensis]|uniref:Probable membrane transporter protein n=1 Tax=Rossellomorea pakistanensis TaxID=992288 RepID=A0ABS2NGR4_9BACI|nr:sulfite exporter TauE/SafE family protein [Bacillus pakistanensis]MBM7587057.1 putative membrane protein YfcA [Bacillus pakistanensis]